MAQLDVFSLTAAIAALLLAGGLLSAWAINRSLRAFPLWAGAFVLLAFWLATATLHPGQSTAWIRWLSWGSFYAAVCVVAHGLHRHGDAGDSPLVRMVAGAILFVAIATALTAANAPPHFWLLFGPLPVLVFMAWSALLVFRAGAWGYGLTLLAGMAAILFRSLFHPAGLARLMQPPPSLRAGFDPGRNPGPDIALHPRPPIGGVADLLPPSGPRLPVEHALTITLVTLAALLVLAGALVLRHVLSQFASMHERSSTDAMTGLLNRVTFEEAAASRLNESGSASTWLILLDIDHFKRINDTAGHAAGDRVIARLGELLRDLPLPDCLAGRIGGEEFAVLLGGGDVATARLYAGAIRAGMAAADFGGQPSWPVTVSAGIALHRPGESLHSLTARADRALYAAKAAGRDRVVVAEDSSGDGRRQPRTAAGIA